MAHMVLDEADLIVNALSKYKIGSSTLEIVAESKIRNCQKVVSTQIQWKLMIWGRPILTVSELTFGDDL